MIALPIGAAKPSTTRATSPIGPALRRLLDDRLCKLGRGLDRAGLLHGEALGWRIDEAAPRPAPHHRPRCAQFGERHASSAQAVGIDQHLQLPVALAPDRDVGDAGHRHQPRADRPAHQLGSCI
jgi:hypothetical protein